MRGVLTGCWLLIAIACGKQAPPPLPEVVELPVARSAVATSSAPSPGAVKAPATDCPKSVAAPAQPSEVDNRMEPERGVALVRACEPCADVNPMLTCLAGGDDFRSFEAKWPRVSQFGSQNLQVDWTMRVLDAALEGNPQWYEEWRELERSLTASAAQVESVDLDELLAAFGRHELTPQQIESACRIASVDAARAPVRQRLFGVASLVSLYVAAATRNRWD